MTRLPGLTSRKDDEMYDCHEDVLAFHNEEVTLPEDERDEMKTRRNTNRQRLKDGLERDGEPSPDKFCGQGSYSHRTMVQHPHKDYDIDDGVYFLKEDLVGPRGGDKSARDAKEMVRKALHDGRFNRPPEVRTNCVRVFYDVGYHVDVPVYRIVDGDTRYEHASVDWKPSDPAEVTRWFTTRNDRLSPDTSNGGQLRRLTRLNKAFARSRESWRPGIATGFMITTLIANECYRRNNVREDRALYDTMVAMRDRLAFWLEIPHPTMPGEMLTRGPDDARTRFLRDRLAWAIDELQVLFEPDCTRMQALKAWDSVFNTTFFSERAANEDAEGDAQRAGRATSAALIATGHRPSVSRSVNPRGSGRYA